MGFFDKLDWAKNRMAEKQKEKKQEELPEGKYAEQCSFCGGTGTEKKWMGQYWHKRCLRNMKKGARKMI